MRAKRYTPPQGAQTENVIAYERGVTDGGRDPDSKLPSAELNRRCLEMPGYRMGYRKGQQLARGKR